MYKKKEFKKALQDYTNFLKLKKIYKKKDELKYEFTIEKLKNWKNSSFNENLRWYLYQKRQYI